MTDEERRRAIRERPEWVGPRDGVPATARHEANLVLLARAEEVAWAKAREARRSGWVGNAAERTRADEHVAALQAVRDVLARRDGGERLLLLIDPRGLDVKAVVALGDVDRAEHVVTFVGGLSTMVGTDLRRYDDTFVRMRSEARSVAAGQDVAIVTWMGYDAPQVHEIVSSIDRNVLNAKLARDNAGALADFAPASRRRVTAPPTRPCGPTPTGPRSQDSRPCARAPWTTWPSSARPGCRSPTCREARSSPVPSTSWEQSATTSSTTGGWCTAPRPPRWSARPGCRPSR